MTHSTGLGARCPRPGGLIAPYGASAPRSGAKRWTALNTIKHLSKPQYAISFSSIAILRRPKPALGSTVFRLQLSVWPSLSVCPSRRHPAGERLECPARKRATATSLRVDSTPRSISTDPTSRPATSSMSRSALRHSSGPFTVEKSGCTFLARSRRSSSIEPWSCPDRSNVRTTGRTSRVSET